MVRPDGEPHSLHEVVADHVGFLGSAPGNGDADAGEPA